VITIAAVRLQVDDGSVLLPAASLRVGPVAPASMVTAFDAQLAQATQSASGDPLPTTLGDFTITIQDAAGVQRSAGLSYVSSSQINFTVPADTAAGAATVIVTSAGQTRQLGTLQVAAAAPGLFFLNSDGLAKADWTRISGGVTTSGAVSQLDSATSQYSAVPIDLGSDTDQVYLTLYATGVRFRSSLDSVRVLVGGVPAPVDYAGPSNTSEGLDFVRVLLPKGLRGIGPASVSVTVDGAESNNVGILIQ
jgi:uncharacterized protein (TIGR03437 family)